MEIALQLELAGIEEPHPDARHAERAPADLGRPTQNLLLAVRAIDIQARELQPTLLEAHLHAAIMQVCPRAAQAARV